MPRPDLIAYRPCVGIVLCNRTGQVWIGRRTGLSPRPDGADHFWQMPQGGIDKGEDPQSAAIRELHEETGVRNVRVIGESPGWYRYDLPAEAVGKALGGKFRGQEQKWFLMRFLGDDQEFNLEPEQGHREFDTWRWADIEEVTDLVVPFKQEVYRQVIAEFGPLVVDLK